LIKAEDVLRGVERLLNGVNRDNPASQNPHLPQFIIL
jgi:hypothetical protein